jgi:hypothetical protein
MGTCAIGHNSKAPTRQAKGVGTAVHVHNEVGGQASFTLSRFLVSARHLVAIDLKFTSAYMST